MAKKTRTKGKDDDKRAKDGGNKPVKVVTFDTPKTDSSEPELTDDRAVDIEPAVSGSAAWGETAGDGGWNSSLSGTGWGQSSAEGSSGPTPQPPPVPPPVPPKSLSPNPTSSRSSRSPSVTPDASSAKASEKAMLDETRDDFQTWGSHSDSATDHEWGSPLSNATTHIAPTSPTQPHSLSFEPQSFSAVGAAMQGPKPQKYTSASEWARKHARTPAAPQAAPKLPPSPKPVVPEPPSAAVNPKSTLTAQQWTTWTKAVPPSPAFNNRFGNRDDYAVVAAALENDIRKAAAAVGHYQPKVIPPQSREWADPAKRSRWSQQGKPTSSRGSQLDDGWDAPRGSDTAWDSKSKRKSGAGSGWANGSEAGWSQSGRSGHHPQKYQTQTLTSNAHKPSKSWQAWGGRRTGKTESESEGDDEEWVEEDDWYAEQTSKGGDGWGAHGDVLEDKSGGWGAKHGGWEDGGWGGKSGGWEDKNGVSGGKSGGWEDRSSGWGDKGGGWGDKSTGGRGGKGGTGVWDDKPGESYRAKDSSGWNTSDGDPWTIHPGGRDQQLDDRGWGATQSSWGGSKVITDPPENYGARSVLSPQQRSQILNSLLNNTQKPSGHSSHSRYPHGVTLTDNPVPRKSHKPESSAGGWGNDTGWGPIHEEDEETETATDDEHRQSFIPPQKHDPWSNKIDDTSYSMPSRILTYASKDTKTPILQGKPKNSMHEYTSIQFVESHGAALQPVEEALFGRKRWAKDRIHWMFPPDKDERVTQILGWIESVSYQLGTFGLHKFLQSRERGALLINAGFRLPELPGQPAFDWLTFDQLQGTMDKTLQESVVFYDPATQVIVFVFLPSKSGNSIAVWRRKIKVPNNIRLMYQQHITQAVAGLKKELDYTVYVDRLPLRPEDPDKPKAIGSSKKRKLFRESPSKPPKSGSTSPKKSKWWQIFK